MSIRVSNKIAALAAFGVLAAASIATVIVLITSSGDPEPAAAPQPITRSELMRQYAEINPIDRSATPETIDAVANSMCTLLRQGNTTDKLITVATQMYKSNATAVVKLSVSYRCPEYLKDFK